MEMMDVRLQGPSAASVPSASTRTARSSIMTRSGTRSTNRNKTPSPRAGPGRAIPMKCRCSLLLAAILLQLGGLTAVAAERKAAQHRGTRNPSTREKLLPSGSLRRSKEVLDYDATPLRPWGRSRRAVPALTELLNDKDVRLVQAAAMALEGIGPDAKTAVPALAELVKAKRPLAPEAAAMALTKIGPAAVPALVELLNDQDPMVRIEAAQALWQHRPGGQRGHCCLDENSRWPAAGSHGNGRS